MLIRQNLLNLFSMSSLRNLTAEDICHQFHLPRLAAKQIQEATQKLNDPNSTIMHILSQNIKNKKKAEASSKKRHSLKNVAGTSFIEDQNAYKRHLRNYSPKNSSISDLYQAKQIQQRFNPPKDFFFKPPIRIASIEDWQKKPTKIIGSRSRVEVSHNTIEQISPENSPSNQQFKGKLRQIRKNSQYLHLKSRNLSRKAKLAYLINDKSYNKVEDSSKKFLLDLEPLKLQEQFSRTFRRNLIDLSFTTKKLTQQYRRKPKKNDIPH